MVIFLNEFRILVALYYFTLIRRSSVVILPFINSYPSVFLPLQIIVGFRYYSLSSFWYNKSNEHAINIFHSFDEPFAKKI